MVLSDSAGSIKDKMGAWIRTDIWKTGLVLKANSKQMGRAAGGLKHLSRALVTCSLSRPCLLGLQFPVFHLQPDSPYLFLISLLTVLLTALLFSHRGLRPEPRLLCKGVLRTFCPYLSLSPLSWGVADAQQRWHGGLSVCSVPATDLHLDRQLNTSQLSLPACEFWQSGALCNDPHWIEPRWLNVSVPPSSESRNTFSRYR